MSLKDAMRKAAGLLVELPPDEIADATDDAPPNMNELLSVLEDDQPMPARTVQQIVAASPGPNLDQIKAAPAAALPPDGNVDFGTIYQGAGLPPTPFSAEQMLDMIASLPPELPLDTRRQTVKVTLSAVGKSLGASPETIVTDASRKLAALHSHVENLEKHTNDLVAANGAEVAALQAQIEAKRQAIDAARRQLAEATEKCVAESHRLDDVLEFFSLDVAPSKHAEATRGLV